MIRRYRFNSRLSDEAMDYLIKLAKDRKLPSMNAALEQIVQEHKRDTILTPATPTTRQ